MLSFLGYFLFPLTEEKSKTQDGTFSRLHSLSVFELWFIPNPGFSNSKIRTFYLVYIATIAPGMKPQVTLCGMIPGFSDELWQVG